MLALTPPAFVFVGIIWRDILLAESWLLAAALAYAVADAPRRSTSGGLPRRRSRWRCSVSASCCGRTALFAAPILAAYLVWPARFDLKRAAILYVPAALVLALLVPLVYYGMLDARHENPLHAIFVFDLGGITHFTGSNQFPVTWSADETAMLTGRCYQPTDWDIYWTRDPCRFVMAKLETEKLFGSSALTEAWLRALAAHPLAYLEHRAAVMANFLFGQTLTMWTVDIAHPDRIVFADNPWFMALKATHDRLAPTPLFRAGTWLAAVHRCGAASRGAAAPPRRAPS